MARIAAMTAYATRIAAPSTGETIVAGVSAVWLAIAPVRKSKLVSDAERHVGGSGEAELYEGTV